MRDKRYYACRERAKELLSKMTLEEKCGLVTTHQRAIERLGLPELHVGTEAARGYVGRTPERVSTVFPQPEGLAATFDRELLLEIGVATGKEFRAYYNKDKDRDLTPWGPTVDLARNPLWGRNEESYGEDPCLTGILSAAYTEGMAGDNGTHYATIPTLKHFCANNNEESRATSNSVMPLPLKYDYYYKSFEYPIRHGGARSMMAAYNEINGVPALLNPELRTKVKDEWGLWFVVSDGGDFTQNLTAHEYVDTFSEAYALSVKAGADLMADNEFCAHMAAMQAIKDGRLTEAELDESVADVLTARILLGQVDDHCDYDSITTDILECEEHQKTNKRAAMEQMVLLKNDGLLPIRKAPKKVAVVGPHADENRMDWYTGYSSWEHTVLCGVKEAFSESEVTYDSLWDRVAVLAPNGKYWSVKEDGTVVADADTIGEDEIFEHEKWGMNWNNFFSVKHQRYVRLYDDGFFHLHNRKVYEWFTRETIVETEVPGGMVFEEWLHRRRLYIDENGKLSVRKSNTVTPDTIFQIVVLESGEERAKKLAKEHELVIYCVGNHPTQVAKECYDRNTLRLNIQENMALVLHENNSNTVLVMVSGYPYSIVEEDAKLPAILWTSHAGPFLGDAVAATILGTNNPAGRLSQTWYRTEKDLPSIMEYDIEKYGSTYLYFTGTPLYPFGHGLSYAAFSYANASVTEKDGKVFVSVDVTNTSDIDGDEVVQVYYRVKDSALPRPIKKLCGFERVAIAAGETKTVCVEAVRDFLEAYSTSDCRSIVESGEYEFLIGASSSDIRETVGMTITGEKPGLRSGVIEAESFDETTDITIRYEKHLESHYISGTGWVPVASYDRVAFSGKNTLRVLMCAIAGKGNLQVTVEGAEAVSIEAAPSDGYMDAKWYEIPMPKTELVSGRLTLVLGGVSVYKIELR